MNEEQIKAAAVEDVAKAQNRLGSCPEALQQVMGAGWKPVHIEAGVGEFSWNCTIHATSTVNSMMVGLRADVDAQGTIRDESGERVFWVMVDAMADDARWKTIVRDDYSTPSPEDVVNAIQRAKRTEVVLDYDPYSPLEQDLEEFVVNIQPELGPGDELTFDQWRRREAERDEVMHIPYEPTARG